MKFKGKKRLYQQGGVAWHNQLPEVEVRAQAPTRNKYVTASAGHQANVGVIPRYADRKKTNAEIMAEARRNAASAREDRERAEREQRAYDNIPEAQKEAIRRVHAGNAAAEREAKIGGVGAGFQKPQPEEVIYNPPRMPMPRIQRPSVGGVTPIQGNRPNVPRQRPAPGNPQQIANPNVGVEQPTRPTPPWITRPVVDRDGNTVQGPGATTTAPVQPTQSVGNTRGIGQRVLGFAGQAVGGAIDGALSLPRQAYHGIARGVHNLNYAAGRAVFGQTGETPAYPEYQHDRTFQTLGRNAGETMGHATDKLSAIPEAGAAALIDGGINLAGRGIHELNYGMGRVISGGKWVTPEYQPVNPAMSAMGYVRGMPGETYQDRVSNSDIPTYGKLYGQEKGTKAKVMPFMDSIARDEQAYQSAVRKAQTEARVTNAQKKKDKAEKKAAAEAERRKYWEDNNIKFQRRGGWLFQQGGQMPQEGSQEGSQEELVLDFAVRYLVTMGVPETEIMDPQGNLNPEYQQELEQVFNSQEIAWSDYAASPDEYMQQFIGNLQAQTQMARKGAKLKRLSKLRIYKK